MSAAHTSFDYIRALVGSTAIHLTPLKKACETKIDSILNAQLPPLPPPTLVNDDGHRFKRAVVRYRGGSGLLLQDVGRAYQFCFQHVGCRCPNPFGWVEDRNDLYRTNSELRDLVSALIHLRRATNSNRNRSTPYPTVSRGEGYRTRAASIAVPSSPLDNLVGLSYDYSCDALHSKPSLLSRLSPRRRYTYEPVPYLRSGDNTVTESASTAGLLNSVGNRESVSVSRYDHYTPDGRIIQHHYSPFINEKFDSNIQLVDYSASTLMHEPPSEDTTFVDSSSDVADSLFSSDADTIAPTDASEVNDTTDVIEIFDSDDESTLASTKATASTSDAEISDSSSKEEQDDDEESSPGTSETCEPLPMAISKIKKSIVHDMTIPVRVFIWSLSADVVADRLTIYPRVQPDGSITLFLRDWRNAFKKCGIDLDDIGNITRSSAAVQCQWLSMTLANYCQRVSKPNMILFISKEDIIVDLNKFFDGFIRLQLKHRLFIGVPDDQPLYITDFLDLLFKHH
ncbi:hypothetical protein C8F01DRAFT_1236816 [Mycena amicta]|nr:hypothetical protein C8F01DRAFT_1236816 [Mycena amicta]